MATASGAQEVAFGAGTEVGEKDEFAQHSIAGKGGDGGPESAKVLEDAMQKAGEEAEKDAKGAEKLEDLEALGSLEGGEKVLGSSDECRSKDPAHCPVHGTPETKETGESGKSGGSANASPRKPTVGSKNPDTPEVQAKQLAKAKAALAKCLQSQEDVRDAFHRGDIGNIDVRWEKERKGLRHLGERRNGYAKSHPGAPDGRQTLEKIAETVVRGEITEVSRKSGHNTVAIEHEGFRALLTQDDEGGNHWMLSGYEISDEARGYRKKVGQG